jgi:hypothetical protein
MAKGEIDLAAITLLLGWSIPFGWEAVTATGWRRYGAAILAVLFLAMGVLWLPLESALPNVAAFISHLAANGESWVLLAAFVAAIAIFTGPQFKRVAASKEQAGKVTDNDGALDAGSVRDEITRQIKISPSCAGQ